MTPSALALAAALAPVKEACDAAALFARVRTVTGDGVWNRVSEIVGTGKVYDSGLTGSASYAFDTRTAKSAVREDLDLEKISFVFDGRTMWYMDSTLGVHRLDAPDARAAAASDAYLRRNGYFSPASDPATFACLGTRNEQGRTLDVVRVTPRGGRSVTVWIDRASGIIDRTAQQAPTAVLTTTYADYRSVHGLVLPFEITTSDGTPGGTTRLQFSHYIVREAAVAADFRPPVAPTNQRMLGNAVQTTVPFRIENDEAVVDATIDGRGPFPFILDTGGHAILTKQAAAMLRLRAQGSGQSGGGGEGKVALQFARSRTLRIGDAELENVPFLVIPYGPDFYDRGPGKAPLAGILGLEFFERFAVRIDYGRRLLTLTPLASFTYAGNGTALPISFQEDLPLTEAAADGHRGLFEVDTGNGGSTILIGDYLKHNGFFERYRNGLATTSSGTGGAVYNTTYRLRRFSIAGYDLNDFIVNFVVQHKGTFSSRTEAGNVGFDVLSQFTPTFDYRRERLYLERRPDAPAPPFNRLGIAATSGPNGSLAVVRVLPGSPARDAGITAGDHITAVDGIAAAQLGALRFRALSRGPVGARIALTFEHAGRARTVALRLRELLCNESVPCTPSVTPAR